MRHIVVSNTINRMRTMGRIKAKNEHVLTSLIL